MRPFYRVPAEKWRLTTNGKVAAYRARALADPAKDEHHIEEYVRQWVLEELKAVQEITQHHTGVDLLRHLPGERSPQPIEPFCHCLDQLRFRQRDSGQPGDFASDVY
jgi:hypothetical protein